MSTSLRCAKVLQLQRETSHNFTPYRTCCLYISLKHRPYRTIIKYGGWERMDHAPFTFMKQMPRNTRGQRVKRVSCTDTYLWGYRKLPIRSARTCYCIRGTKRDRTNSAGGCCVLKERLSVSPSFWITRTKF